MIMLFFAVSSQGVVTHSEDAEASIGSRGDLPNKELAFSDNSSTKAYDPNLVAKSNGAPAIYNELKQSGNVRIILRYKIKSGLPKSSAQNNDLKQYKQDKAIIEEKILLKNFGTNELKKIRGARRPLRRYDISPMMAMTVDQSELEAIAADPEITAIYADSLNYTNLQDSVPLIGMEPNGAYTLGATGTGQAVAVLDTGVQSNHPFLSGKVVGEACFSNSYSGAISLCPNGTSSQTGTGAAEATTSACINGLDNLCTHGTHVAGIAAGKNTTVGIPPNGVSKESKIIAIQVFTRFPDNSIGAYDSDILAGLNWLYLNINSFQSVTVAAANMSLGGGYYSSACDDNVHKLIIDQLRAAGVATIIAAGNDGLTGYISSPGCISTAITVGATTKSNAVAIYSNEHETMLDLLAPGSLINSSIPPSTYAYYSGTSMATPHVAGSFAAIRSRLPNATVGAIESALKVSGIPIPSWWNTFTTPLIQVDDALNLLGLKTDQTINFGTAPSVSVNGTGTVSATATSGLAVTFTSATSSVCSISGTTVTGLSPGSCGILANQTGNSTYNAAPQATQTFTVENAKTAQKTVVFSLSPSSVPVGSSATLKTSGGTGKGAISYTITQTTGSTVCNISASKVFATGGSGTCTLIANKAGDTTYNSATSAPKILTVNKANQAKLTLKASPTVIKVGGTSTLSTSGGTGSGVVSYSVSSPIGKSSCTVTGNQLLITGVKGGCKVKALKEADQAYNAAVSAVVSVKAN